jgi:hypothetical protein
MKVSAAQLAEPVINNNGISVCISFTCCYLFYLRLFNNAVNSSDYITLNDRMIIE